MDTLLLTFANQQVNPLQTLQEEDDALNRLLAPRANEQHFQLQRDSHVSLEKLPSYLTLYRDSLAVFLFSGHAGKDQLFFTDGEASSQGIAAMLGMCPNLKLVFLNGCSTQGQVNELLKQGIPIVMATSAPVDDRKATQFSKHFFEALQQQFSLKAAFDMAKAALQTAHKDLEIIEHRGVFNLQKPEEATWGLFFDEKKEHLLDWKLPIRAPKQSIEADFTPNQYLIDTLFLALGEYNENIKQLQKQDKGLTKVSLANKRMAVLNALPAPLAEPLRKLVVPVEQENEGFDKVSTARIRQISQAYATALELLAFTMLAQLWQAHDDLGGIVMGRQEREALRQFFALSKTDHELFNLLDLVVAIRGVFSQNNIDFFVQELNSISELAQTDDGFAESLHFLNGLRLQLRQQALDPSAIAYLCHRGEKSLTYLYSKLGFMARYRLATIQGIDVEKYRHQQIPSYNHATVVLHDLLGGFDVSAVSLNESLDNRSVLLIDDQTWDYLNRSPFVIDENAFHKDTDVCKLYFFSHYLKGPKTLFYKYVYKPDDPMLEVPGKKFELVKQQFDAFAMLLLQQPLDAL